MQKSFLMRHQFFLSSRRTIFFINEYYVITHSASISILLQSRAKSKYHSGGLWTNTCCSHPSPGEETLAGAHRRLKEEMGFDCDIKEIGALLYKTKFDNGLIENEFDHIFLGGYDGIVDAVDPNEAEAWKWVHPEELLADMKANPDSYTYWFKLSIEDVLTKR